MSASEPDRILVAAASATKMVDRQFPRPRMGACTLRNHAN
jgi:hypothetical protein